MPTPEEPGTNQNATDPATDIPLYCSARFSSYAFKKITSGTDIYAKIEKDKTPVYYLLHWHEEQSNECVKIPEECAIRLLRGLAVMPDTLAGMEFVNILHHLPDYFSGKKRSLDVVYIAEDDECGKYVEYFRQGTTHEIR